MEKSESIKNLAIALCKFQSEISTVTKNKKVKVKTKNGGEYSFPYADFECIRDAIKQPLLDNGLSFSQPVSSDGLVTILMHESGEYLCSTLALNINQQPQDLGSEITYKRRYALSSILGLSTDDDDDGNLASGNEVKSSQVNDDKPWYNEPDYQADLERITVAIRGGTPPDNIIKTISANFKISKKYRDLIKSI